MKRQKPTGIDVVTTLAHFAIVTYMVEPEHLRPHVHQRFALDTITAPDGSQKALISVVPFEDRDFRFVRFPFYKWHFGQTNYRAYVTDKQTGEHVVWFFGTSLASATVAIPRYLWQLPWHRADIRFDTEVVDGRYQRYRMTTRSDWAEADLVLHDTGKAPQALIGFSDLEAGLLLLTHPMRGYYYRRDGKLGGYNIWHDRLQMTMGEASVANFALLDHLGLVEIGDLSTLHSILIQPETEFTIYLPPTTYKRTTHHAPLK